MNGNLIPNVEVKIDQHVNTHPTSKTGEFFFIMTQGQHIIEISAKGECNKVMSEWLLGFGFR